MATEQISVASERISAATEQISVATEEISVASEGDWAAAAGDGQVRIVVRVATVRVRSARDGVGAATCQFG